jgi:hypothetical protein
MRPVSEFFWGRIAGISGVLTWRAGLSDCAEIAVGFGRVSRAIPANGRAFANLSHSPGCRIVNLGFPERLWLNCLTPNGAQLKLPDAESAI